MEREGRHMARIGISIYPEHTTPERDRAYMEMAAKYGCSRIFFLFVERYKKPGGNR